MKTIAINGVQATITNIEDISVSQTVEHCAYGFEEPATEEITCAQFNVYLQIEGKDYCVFFQQDEDGDLAIASEPQVGTADDNAALLGALTGETIDRDDSDNWNRRFDWELSNLEGWSGMVDAINEKFAA
jgi:hypothetical protein